MAVLSQPSSVLEVRGYLGRGIENGFSLNVTQADASTATTVNGASQSSDTITVASTANMAVGCFIGIAVTGGTVNRLVLSITSSTVVVVDSPAPVGNTWTNGGAITIEPIDANGPFTYVVCSAAGTVKYVDLYGNLVTQTVQASDKVWGVARVYDTGTSVSDANLAGHR